MVEDVSFDDCGGVFSDLVITRVEGCIVDPSLHTATKLGAYFWKIFIVSKLEVCNFS
jgi:hypothetical protein